MRLPTVAASTVAAAAALLALGLSPAPATVGAAGGPTVGRCQVFPTNNYWNTRITHLPVSRYSRTWLQHMAPSSNLHPDFGPSFGAQPVPYGIPITTVTGAHATVPVRFRYAAESDRVRYPLGNDTRIEGGWGASGDRHAIVVNTTTCTDYETYDTRRRNGRWTAGSGAVFSLTSNRLRPNGWTSADAAGLPILPGLLRWSEVRSGHVNHAIRFTTDITDARHIWPARHDASSVHNHNYPPMGARFRLRMSYDISHFRPAAQVVLRAMKQYGLVLADNGSPWYFQGAASRQWPVTLLDALKTIPARAFQAVDTSTLKVGPNSAQARQP